MGVVVDGEVIRATDMAVLVRVKPDPQFPGFETPAPREVWMPRSVIDGGYDLDVGDTDITVRTWFAEKEGLD
jgi:hypothetical protein